MAAKKDSEDPDTTSSEVISSHSETESRADQGAEEVQSPHPGSLPRKTWVRVRAINAQFIAERKRGTAREQAVCVAVQQCYDVLIEGRTATDLRLPESVLVSEIPQKVLELAAEMGWLSAAIFDVSRPAPPDNPAGSAKKYLVEPAYRTWLWDLLEARAEYWRARMYAEPSDGELLKPEFVVRPLPAATPEGLVFQAEDSLTERRVKEPKTFSAYRLWKTMFAAGVPRNEITARRMVETAADAIGDRTVTIALIDDLAAAPVGESTWEGKTDSTPGIGVTAIDQSATDPVADERVSLLRNYKSRGRKQAISITDKMMAKATNPNWNDRTMITRWKRNDPRCSPRHDRMIRAVLEKDSSSIWEPNIKSKPTRV
jgi:hypothetical protein